VSVCTSSDGRQLMRHCTALCCCSHARWPGRVMVCSAWCVPAYACAPESMACLHRMRRIEETSVVTSISYICPFLRSLFPKSHANQGRRIGIAHGKGKDFDAACQTLPHPTRALPPPDGPLAQASCMLVALAGALVFPTARCCSSRLLECASKHLRTSTRRQHRSALFCCRRSLIHPSTPPISSPAHPHHRHAQSVLASRRILAPAPRAPVFLRQTTCAHHVYAFANKNTCYRLLSTPTTSTVRAGIYFAHFRTSCLNTALPCSSRCLTPTHTSAPTTTFPPHRTSAMKSFQSHNRRLLQGRRTR
jgi:hypothetical protein